MAARLQRLPAWVFVVALIALGALSMGRQWGGEILWELDGLFYQAHVEQLRGADREDAIRDVFSGPLAQRARAIEAATEDQLRVRDPDWPLYTERFYARRWSLPALSAGLYPVLGDHGLETLSLLGYVAIGPLMFLLLGMRFSRPLAFAVAACALALPPLRDWSVFPLTDSAGVALLIAGLLAAMAVLSRGLRWVVPWMLCILALSLTRDTAFILVLAAGVLALMRRDRKSVALVAAGAIAAMPAPLIWSVGVREQLAFVFSDHIRPADTSWSFVLGEFLPHLREVAGRYADYAADNPHVMLVFLLGVGCALLLAPRRDPFFILLKGTLLGYFALLLVGPTFSSFRYELVLVPLVGTGLALGAERLLAAAPRYRSLRRLSPSAKSARISSS
jgi:hypothetical protein